MKKYIPGRVNMPLGCTARFSLEVDDCLIWNRDKFIKFLIENQHNVIDVEIPEGSCLASLGVYKLLDLFKFKAVTVRTNNIIEKAPSPYLIDYHPLCFQYFNTTGADYSQHHEWNSKKIFGALYNRPTWTRIGLAAHLLDTHQEKTLINFRFNPHNEDERRSFELEKLFQVDTESIKKFSNIVDKLPIQLEHEDGYTEGASVLEHTNQLTVFYCDFLIDVVAETSNVGRSFYPTEKTIRPMLMKKPFIIMGPKCFLIHLRQMGFRTFYEFWDEDYDGYSPEIRYLMILKLIDSLASKSLDELQDLYIKMEPILDHNYNLLVNNEFSTKINYVE